MSCTAYFVKHVEAFLVAELKPVALWPEAHHLLYHEELHLAEASYLIVEDMDLYALAEFAFEDTVVGLEVDRTEINTRQLERVEGGCQTVGIDPWCTHDLERQGIAHTDIHIAKLTEDTCHAVEHSRLALWYVWRCHDPLQTRLVPSHGAFPALHSHDVQFALALIVGSIEVERQLTWGLTIYVGYAELAHETLVAIFYDVAFDLLATEWVRAVQHYELFVELNAGLHQFAEGRDIGIAAATIVLNVINHHIDLVHHLLGGLAGLAVETVHLQACLRINIVVHMVTCVYIAAHTVLWTVEGHEINVFGFPEDVNGGLELAIHASGVGGQTYAFAFQKFETVFAENLNTCFNFRCAHTGGEKK